MYNTTKNVRIKNYLSDTLKLNVIQDIIPTLVKTDIQPVIEVDKPKINVIRDAVVSDATTGTVYTTPADYDFYLCGVQVCHVQSSGSPSTATYVQITQDNQARKVLQIANLASTTQSQPVTETIVFDRPLKVDRNSPVTINHGSATTAIRSSITIWGYVETIGEF